MGLDFDRLLALSFKDDELEYLLQFPEFTEARARLQTDRDLDALCVIAERLLDQRHDVFAPSIPPLNPRP